MDYSSNHQYGGCDDRSLGSRCTNQSSISMTSSGKARADEHFMAPAGQFSAATTQDAPPGVTAAGDGGLVVKANAAEDALTAEAESAVTKERQVIYKTEAGKLQSILENVKNSTKNILREMDVYLQETEEVEKAFIRCRANTQKESQRMEQVEPDVIAATQRFVAQGAQLFGGGVGAMDLMNIAALMGNASGDRGAPAPGGNGGGDGASFMGMPSTVTPRGSDAVSTAGSSMAGSMS